MCGGDLKLSHKIKLYIKMSTLGQQRVKAEFNPAKSGIVDRVRNHSAMIIDLVENRRGESDVDVFNKIQSEADNLIDCLTEIGKGTEEKERITELSYELITTAVNKFAGATRGMTIPNDEDFDSVQTDIETACMYAVKSNFTN